MKLIVQGVRVVGTATDSYTGPDAAIDAPIDFDASRMGEYTVIDGVASLPAVNPVAVFDAALTAHLDATAQARKYDNRITCMVRAGFAGPYQAEAIAFAQWCDGCNAAAYQLMLDVQSGKKPMPSSVDAFLEALPVMVWPA